MRDQNHDDEHCMARLKEGDDLALNDLMRRWKEPLVTFALRYTGNATDALEIAQETFVKVYGARRRYRPTAAFSTWLFRIAANLCKMRARWRSRHPEVLEADPGASAEGAVVKAASDDDPRAEVDRRALGDDLSLAIRKLPHDLRISFILFEIESHSYRQIASVQKCSEKAVERRVAKARERLRSILAPKWREPIG